VTSLADVAVVATAGVSWEADTVNAATPSLVAYIGSRTTLSRRRRRRGIAGERRSLVVPFGLSSHCTKPGPSSYAGPAGWPRNDVLDHFDPNATLENFKAHGVPYRIDRSGARALR
jgi:hypothetical protein